MIRKILIYMITLPAAILSWFAVLLIYLFWGSILFYEVDSLWCILKENCWFSRTLYKGWHATTFTMGGFYSYEKSQSPILREHEYIHIKQFIGCMLHALFNAIIAFCALFFTGHITLAIIIGIVIWSLGTILGYFSAGIVACLYGNKFYKNNMFEEAARVLSNRGLLK